MAKGDFDIAFSHMLGHEGAYSNHKDDRGGPTMYGVTLAALRRWRKDNSLTSEDVKKLSTAEARSIAEGAYAKPIWFDDLPVGVDYCMLDMCFNSGPAAAVKIAQDVVGTNRDGAMGQITLAAIKKMSPEKFIIDYCDRRVKFLKSLTTFSTFGRGWMIRVTGEDPKGQWKKAPGVVGTALAMARKVPPASLPSIAVSQAFSVLGGDAKADPSDKKLSATNSGKSFIGGAIALATEGVASSKAAFVETGLVGQGGWADKIFLGITIAGMLVGGVSAAYAFYSFYERKQRGEAVMS